MSRIHLLILWVLALVAGIIVISTKGKNREALSAETSLKQGDSPVTSDDLRGYAGLKFTDSKNTSTLVKKEDAWVVAEENDYPVNLQTLGSAFDIVRELKILQGLPAEPKHWDRFGLNLEAEDEADRPRQLSLLDPEGKVAKTIFIGKARESSGGQRGNTAGRFVRFSSDDSGVYIVQQDFSQLKAEPTSWISKVLPGIEGILSIAMKPDNELLPPWTVSRPTAVGDFTLEDLVEGLETNTTAVEPLKNLFASSAFTELLSPEEVAKRAVVEDAREITIKTASGISYLFTIIPERKDAPQEEPADDQAQKTDDRNYIVSFKLLTGPADPAKPADDASDADKAGYQALVANQRITEARYQEHKAFQGRHYLVNNFVVNPLLKNRHKMHKTKAKPKPAVTTPPIQIPLQGEGATSPARRPAQLPPGFPGGANSKTAPPEGEKAPRKRITAVTKPIAIPRPDDKAETAEEEKPKAEE